MRLKYFARQRHYSHKNPNLTLERSTLANVAVKYHVEDLVGALITSSRISNILNDLESGRQLSNFTKEYLRGKGFLALLSYANNEITISEFSKAAKNEQVQRLAEKASALKEQAEQKLKKEAMIAKQEFERKALVARLQPEKEQKIARRRPSDNDQKKSKTPKNLKLRQKYGLPYIPEKADFGKLMDILRRVDSGVRLSEEEVVWLSTNRDEFGGEYFTETLKEGYHKNEANFYSSEFEKSKDPWFAVNASSHYRKCNQAKTAESILSAIDVSVLENHKLKSALCTTHGGVKRDLARWDEAIRLGMQGHELTPQDFRPCTLIGAVYMETGQHEMGGSWYEKAVERGYSEKSVDDELRGIFMGAEKTNQEALRAYLLSKDPERYSWASKQRR